MIHYPHVFYPSQRLVPVKNSLTTKLVKLFFLGVSLLHLGPKLTSSLGSKWSLCHFEEACKFNVWVSESRKRLHNWISPIRTAFVFGVFYIQATCLNLTPTNLPGNKLPGPQ